MFYKEEVRKEEAIDFAKEINAIYKGIYPNGKGLDELFQCIGKKKSKFNQEDKDDYKDEDVGGFVLIKDKKKVR